MLNQSCRSLRKAAAEVWSGSAPWQMYKVEEHVGIGPLLRGRSRAHPHAKVVVEARGPVQDTNEC